MTDIEVKEAVRQGELLQEALDQIKAATGQGTGLENAAGRSRHEASFREHRVVKSDRHRFANFKRFDL